MRDFTALGMRGKTIHNAREDGGVRISTFVRTTAHIFFSAQFLLNV